VTWLAEAAMLSHGWRRLLLLVAAGAIAALSVPPLFVLPALFVGLPIWVWCLDGAERYRGLRAFFSWFIVLMPFAVVALAAVLALFWAVASALAHLLWSGGALRIVTLASFLSAAEFARGHLFSGFPFDLLGYALTANDEMAQLASVVGVYGLTFLAALLAMTPALIWPPDERSLVRRLTPFFLAVAAIAAQVGWGNYRLSTTELVQRTDMKVRLVQPMITAHADWDAADPAEVMDRLISLSEARLTPADPGLAGITHLVWPESVFPFFLTQYPDALARIARMLPEGTLLLTGAPREAIGPDGLPEEGNPGYNSILAIDSDGEVVMSYDKSHLVPIGEYLPFPEFFGLLGIRQFVPGTNGWAPGDGRRLMTPPGTPPFLALVCYEAVFPGDIGDPTRAQFILNITNDAWYDGSIGPAQHAHHARIRAVETGLPLLRAANTGATMAVDPLGRVTARLAEQEVAVVDVVPSGRLPDETLFVRFWHWPFLAALGLGGLLALWSWWRERPRRA